MAKQGQIKIGVGFNVDKSGLTGITKEFEKIGKLANQQLKLTNSEHTKQELTQITREAEELARIFSQSYNFNLNSMDFVKLRQNLSSGTVDLQQFLNKTQQLGMSGPAAFRSITNELLKSNVTLKQSHELLDKMANTLANTVRWTIASSAVNALTGSIQKAYNYTVDLDTSLNNIRIVTEKSAEEMERFAIKANNAAKALGANTKAYTDASLIYFQQGLNDAEVEKRTQVTLKAANVTGQSAAAVSEQLTAVWNGYKITAENTENAIDKLAAVAASTAADLEELSTGMSRVASAANIMGVDIDQLNAQLATIVSVTREAPESIGTALKTIYARMSDLEAGTDAETTLGEYTQQMAQFGFQALDAQGNLRDMGDVIEEIGNKWGSLSRNQQVALAQTVAGTRQYARLMSLFDNWDMYEEALQTSINSTGTLQKQQDIYMESTEAHLAQLQTQTEDLYKSMFDKELINGAIDGLTNIVEVVDNLVESLGGGANAMLMLSSLATRFFSKKIGEGVSTFVTNRYAKAENKRQVEAQDETLKKAVQDRAFLSSSASASSLFTQDKAVNLEIAKKEDLLAEASDEKESIEIKNEISILKQKLEQLKAEQSKFKNEDYAKRHDEVLDLTVEYQKEAKWFAEHKNSMTEEDQKAYITQLEQRKSAIDALENLAEEQYQFEINLAKKKADEIVKIEKEAAEKLAKSKASKEAETAKENRKQFEEEAEAARKTFLRVGKKRDGGKFSEQTAIEYDTEKSKFSDVTPERMAARLNDEARRLENQRNELNSARRAAYSFKKGPNLQGAESLLNESKQIQDLVNEGKLQADTDILDDFNAKIERYVLLVNKLKEGSLSNTETNEFSNLTAQLTGQGADILNANIEDIEKAASTLEVARERNIQTADAQKKAEIDLANATKKSAEEIEEAKKEVVEKTEEAGKKQAEAFEQVRTEQTAMVEGSKKAASDNHLKVSAQEAGEAFGKLTSGITGVVSGIMTLKHIGGIFKDEDLTAGEKFLQISMALVTSLPMLVTSFSALKTGVSTLVPWLYASMTGSSADTVAKIGQKVATDAATGATVSFGAALWTVLWPIGLVVAAITGLVAVINACVKAYNADADAAKKAKEQLEKQKTTVSELKQEYENLKSSIDSLEDSYDALKNMTEGTKEWAEAVAKVNDEAMNLLQTYPELAKYAYRENGVLKFQQEGLDLIEQKSLNETQTAQRGLIYSQQVSREADIAYERTLLERKIGSIYNAKDAEILGATYNADTGYYEYSEDSFSNLLSKLDESAFDSNSNMYDALKELGLQDERLIQALTSNRETLQNLNQSLQQNNELLILESAQALTSSLEGSGMSSQQAGILGGMIALNRSEDYDEDLAEEKKNLDTGGKKEKNIALFREYAKLVGLDPNAELKQAGGNTIKYIDAEGKKQSLEVADMIEYVARENVINAQATAEEIQEAQQKYDDALKTISLDNLDTYQSNKAILDKVLSSNTALSADALDDFGQEQLSWLEAFIDSEGEGWQNLTDKQKQAFKDTANKLKKQIESVATDSGWSESVKTSYKNVFSEMDKEGYGNATYQQRLLYGDIASRLSISGQNLSAFENITKGLGANLGVFLENTSSSQALDQYIKDNAALFANISTEDLEMFKYQLRQIGDNAFKGTEKIAKLNDILGKLDKKGDAISEEDYKALYEMYGEAAAKYFTQMADGTYALTVSAREFYKITQAEAQKEALNKIKSISEQNTNANAKRAAAKSATIGGLSDTSGTLTEEEKNSVKGEVDNDYGDNKNNWELLWDWLNNTPQGQTWQDNNIVLTEDNWNTYFSDSWSGDNLDRQWWIAAKGDIAALPSWATMRDNLKDARVASAQSNKASGAGEANTKVRNQAISALNTAAEGGGLNESQSSQLEGLKTRLQNGDNSAVAEAKSFIANLGNTVDNSSLVEAIIEGMKLGLSNEDIALELGYKTEDGTADVERMLALLSADQIKQVEDAIAIQNAKEKVLIYQEQAEAIDKINAEYEQMNTLLDAQSNLIKLINGENDYNSLKANLTQQVNIAKSQMSLAKAEMDRLSNAMATETSEVVWQELYEQWKTVSSEYYQNMSTYIEKLKEQELNAINEVFDARLNRVSTSGVEYSLGMEHVSEEWELIKERQEKYLDPINREYRTDSLRRQFQGAINDTSDLNAQKRIRDLMNSELQILKDQDELSEYDLKRAEKKLEILQKEIALRDAQNNKTKMQLMRGADGTYSYQYVADTDAMVKAEEELLAAQNDLYNIDLEEYKSTLDEAFSYYEQFKQKWIEASQIANKEEREARQAMLKEQYLGEGGLISSLLGDDGFNQVLENLGKTGGADIFASFGTADELVRKMSEPGYWEGLTSELDDIDSAYKTLVKDTKDWNEELNDALATVGKIADGLDIAMKTMTNTTGGYWNSEVITEALRGSFKGLTLEWQEGENGNPGKWEWKVASGDTGLYTGEWGKEGKFLMAHEKELLLNKTDTENILNAVSFVRSLDNSLFSRLAAITDSMQRAPLVASGEGSPAIEQKVEIVANFPNANVKEEIEAAFDELINLATQHAFKKKN